MAAKINPEKESREQEQPVLYERIDKLQDMENDLRRFFGRLGKPSSKFKASEAFDDLFRYIKSYDRVLYSTISNIIYAHYNSLEYTTDQIGTIQSNLDELVRYSQDDKNIAVKKNAQSSMNDKEKIDNTRKIILKIWDHVSLASQQYTMLKQTDEEYDAKFKAHIAAYKEEMSKEMNAQMITMVGIFTALAFLIFGSISSLVYCTADI